MGPRIPLHPVLGERAISVAEARQLGIGRGRLAGPDLRRPFRGVRTFAELSAARAYQPLLRPGDRFSHTTAAELWGAPLPAEVEGLLHVTAGEGLQRPRSTGVVGHDSAMGRLVVRNGLPTSDPVRTFLELATMLDHESLVAVGDHLVLDPHVLDPGDLRPYVDLPHLRSAVDGATGRGVRAARAAGAQVRAGVESRPETRLRMLLVGAGVPEPVCGYALTDQRGRRIGWFDLAWPEFRVIAEYDGDGHRTSRDQYDKDIWRFDRAYDIGWKVVRVRSSGLGSHADATVRRVTAALEGRAVT
jgi:hypothetical protein